MKKRAFDIIVILLITIILIILYQFNLLEKTAKFMLIPILAFYYLGQYSERKFQKWIYKFSYSCARFSIFDSSHSCARI